MSVWIAKRKLDLGNSSFRGVGITVRDEGGWYSARDLAASWFGVSPLDVEVVKKDVDDEEADLSR